MKYQLAENNPVDISIFSSGRSIFDFENQLTYFYAMPIVETPSTLLFYASSPEKFMAVIYDKIKNKSAGYSAVRDDLFMGAFMLFPIYAYGDEYYTVLDPEALLSLKSRVEADPENIENFKANYPDAWELIQHITLASSPVIMISELSIGEGN